MSHRGIRRQNSAPKYHFLGHLKAYINTQSSLHLDLHQTKGVTLLSKPTSEGQVEERTVLLQIVIPSSILSVSEDVFMWKK